VNMDLRLRRVDHPTADNNFRVILRDDAGREIEIGSIGLQHGSSGSDLLGMGVRHGDPGARDRDIRHRSRP